MSKKKKLGLTEQESKALTEGVQAAPVPVLRINCTATRAIPLEDLKNFQKGFKGLNPVEEEKFKREIITHGFLSPVVVWANDGVSWIMDGHQRIWCLQRMLKNGEIVISDRIPVSYINASNEEEAARICLALASTYGRIDKDGLSAFIRKHKITKDELQQNFSFPDLELEDFKESKGDKKSKKITINVKKLRCPSCGKEGFKDEFKIPIKEQQEDEDTED